MSHFHRSDSNLQIYGVFDGYNGSRASHFTSKRMPAELLLFSKLNNQSTCEDVKNVLKQAFAVVERGFFESIDVDLAKKTQLQTQVRCFVDE